MVSEIRIIFQTFIIMFKLHLPALWFASLRHRTVHETLRKLLLHVGEALTLPFRALLAQGGVALIILSSAGYSWGREAEKLWAEIWNLTHESWS